jgi:predicted signal transduction protein with EAL and GGDEF domain
LESFRQSLMIEGHTINLTASIGVAMYPTDGAAAQDLWRLADSAMYRAKHAGGNQYVFALRGGLPVELAEFEREIDEMLKGNMMEDLSPGD